jgi:hypothetical protein
MKRILTTLAALGAAFAVAATDAPAAERYCESTDEAQTCFFEFGDRFRVAHTKGDGVGARVEWRTDYGRRGVCRTECNYNMREGRDLQFRLVLINGHRVRKLPWRGAII